MRNKHNTNATAVEKKIREVSSKFAMAGETNVAKEADELRQNGLMALHTLIENFDALENSIVSETTELSKSIDNFVTQNPWRSTVMAAALGIIAGVIIVR